MTRPPRLVDGRADDADVERDPPAFHVLLACAVAALGAIVLFASRGISVSWQDAALWATLGTLSNALPVPTAANTSLSMSSPINIAIAVAMPMSPAGAIVAAASLSEWELRGETTLSHAIYNRVQLGLATAAASAMYRATDALGWAPIVTCVACVAAYHAVNCALVAAAESSCRGVSIVAAARRMLPRPGVGLVTYLLLGFMGFAVEATFERVGAWAVLLLMLPLLGARHTIAVAGALERAERAQRRLADRLIDERERERTRIAADIHDVVVQDLVAQQLLSRNLKNALERDDFDVVMASADGLERGAARALESLRGFVASLRRSALDDEGLTATLRRYGRSFAAQTGTDVTVTGDVGDVPLPAALLLYECGQELLTNVARHARASTVEVRLRRVGDVVELVVDDDGEGIVPERLLAIHESGASAGLALLREKVELSGGIVRIARRATGGTEVLVSTPIGGLL